MPFFSIVVPAYNNAPYLPGCLDSLTRQTLSDWEAVIVVDGSPDDSLVANQTAQRDPRMRVIDKAANEGTHRARKTGVAACTGQYTLFLDADDELLPHALEQLKSRLDSHIDVLHFGMELVNCGMPQTRADAVLRQCNADFPTLRGEEILAAAFAKPDEQRQDWRILQRVYRTPLLQAAFASMTDERLGRGQDSYEWMVIASLSNIEENNNDLIGYRYYFGRGITTESHQTVAAFMRQARQYLSIIEAAKTYDNGSVPFDMRPYSNGLSTKLLYTLTNDWLSRVPDQDKEFAARQWAELFGDDIVASELARISRDHAYRVWDQHLPFDGTEPFVHWLELAQSLVDGKMVSDTCAAYLTAAKGHIADIRARDDVSRPATETRTRSCLSFIRKLLTKGSSS